MKSCVLMMLQLGAVLVSGVFDVAGAVLVSGVFDVRPIVNTSINDLLNLTL